MSLAHLNRKLIQLSVVLVALILVPGIARAQKHGGRRRRRRVGAELGARSAPVIGWRRWKPS